MAGLQEVKGNWQAKAADSDKANGLGYKRQQLKWLNQSVTEKVRTYWWAGINRKSV
jgi:hypothetical protein